MLSKTGGKSLKLFARRLRYRNLGKRASSFGSVVRKLVERFSLCRLDKLAISGGTIVSL